MFLCWIKTFNEPIIWTIITDLKKSLWQTAYYATCYICSPLHSVIHNPTFLQQCSKASENWTLNLSVRDMWLLNAAYKYCRNCPQLMEQSLLFISYKFVKRFLAITFLKLVFSNWNLHDMRQRLLCNQKRNFSWLRQKIKNFPIHPIVKITHLGSVQRHDVTKVAKFLIFCQIQLKFHFWLHKRRWRISCKFQFEITSYNKVIVKKPLTNYYEMYSSLSAGFHQVSWYVLNVFNLFLLSECYLQPLVPGSKLSIKHYSFVERYPCLFILSLSAHVSWYGYVYQLICDR